MDWEAIGAVGDAVGGIGVVASLLYLAFQTRQNTRAVRAASFQQVVDSFAEISLTVFANPALAKLLNRTLAGEAVGEEESGQLSFFYLTFFRRAESMFFHTESGTLQEETWVGIEGTLVDLMATPEGRAWWNGTQNRFNPAFCQYVNERLIPKAASR